MHCSRKEDTSIPLQALLSTATYNKLLNGYAIAVTSAFATDLGTAAQVYNVLREPSDFIRCVNEINSLWDQVAPAQYHTTFYDIANSLGRRGILHWTT